MNGYVKLFSDIVDSSIWNEDPITFKVWIALLALSDPSGQIRGSTPWLAKKARVSEKQCELALIKFTQPDPESRTKDYDGRRIEVLEDGWLVLNYLRFRDRLSNNEKALASRERVRKHRERYKALRNASGVTPHDSVSVYVHDRIDKKEESVREEGKGRTVTFIKPSIEEVQLQATKIGLDLSQSESFFNYYESNGWKVGRNPMRSWPHALSNWKLNHNRYKPNASHQPINKRNQGTYETKTDFASAAAKRSFSSQMAKPTNQESPKTPGT